MYHLCGRLPVLFAKVTQRWPELHATMACSEQSLFHHHSRLFPGHQQCCPGETSSLGGPDSNVRDVLPEVARFPVFGDLSPMRSSLKRTYGDTLLASRVHPVLCVHRSCLHTSTVLVSGSNKWSKIKEVKGAKDRERSILAAKLVKQMRVVMREGGADPDTNPELARLIALAKSRGIPKSSVENTIKNAANSKDKVGSQYICEGQGPKGSAIIVEYITDNQNRSRFELGKIFKAHGCTMGGQGSVLYAFKKKGVIELSSQDDQNPMTFDLAMELAIEAGAEDVIQEEEDGQPVFKFMCDQADFRSVRVALGGTGHKLGMASLDFTPESNVALPQQELERIGVLIAELEEHADVVKVSHNIVEEET